MLGNVQKEWLVMHYYNCWEFSVAFEQYCSEMDQICNPSSLEEAHKSSWMDGETIDLHNINMYESNTCITYMWFTSESLKI